MNSINITGNSAAASATDAVVNNGTASSGVAITLLLTETSDGLAHKLIITPSGSVTGNYGISGNNANGEPISETLATNTTNAVTSAKYYMDGFVITAPSGLAGQTVDIGWTAASVSAWDYSPGKYGIGEHGIGFAAIVDSGSPTYSVQHTLDGGVTAFTHSTVTGETTSQEGTYTTPIQAIRLVWTAAGEVTLRAWY